MLMNKITKYSLGALMVAIAGSCSLSTKMDATIDREVEATTQLKETAKIPDKALNDDVVRVKNDIWLGDSSQIEYEGQPIPSYLEGKDGITLISNRPITLYEIGDMINKITGMRVSYATHLEKEVLSNGAKNKPTAQAINADWTDPSKMLVSYQGPLKSVPVSAFGGNMTVKKFIFTNSLPGLSFYIRCRARRPFRLMSAVLHRAAAVRLPSHCKAVPRWISGRILKLP